MSFAAQTWTMNTAGPEKWILSDGTITTLKDTAQTVSFTATDTGDGGIYFGKAGNSIALIDGSNLIFDGNKDITFFKSEADGATVRNGSIWARIDGGKLEEVSIVGMTVTNGDAVGADNLASITFEYPGKPYRWTWTLIDTA